jgi:hypothetical protein
MLAKRGAALGNEATAGLARVRGTLATAFATDQSSTNLRSLHAFLQEPAKPRSARRPLWAIVMRFVVSR